MIQPLTESESTKAIFQYSVLHNRMKTLIAGEAEENKRLSLSTILYKYCTNKNLYKDSDLATYIMLFNTVITTNECVIESLNSRIENHNSQSRPLKEEQLQCEMMVRENGPHPLHTSTPEFLRISLQEHFKGGPDRWNFIRGNWSSNMCSSKFSSQ